MNKELGGTNNGFNYYYQELIHRYFLFLFFLFLFHSLFCLFFFRDGIASIFLVLFTLLFAFLVSIKREISQSQKIQKPLVTVVFIMLTLVVSFFYSYTWKRAGVEYFYFTLLFALPFYFKYKEDYYFILMLVIFIVFNFIGSLCFDLSFIPKSKFIKDEDFEILRSINIFFAISLCLIGMTFLYKKDKLIYRLMKEQRVKDGTIEDLVKVNDELMKRQVSIHHLTEENIEEILALAEQGSSIFMEKFKIYFPDFIPGILKINSDLIRSEINICALMKLNLDTKKIALYTNSSVRAIESRKYRIRKKLGIPSDMDINNFILKV